MYFTTSIWTLCYVCRKSFLEMLMSHYKNLWKFLLNETFKTLTQNRFNE